MANLHIEKFDSQKGKCWGYWFEAAKTNNSRHRVRERGFATKKEAEEAGKKRMAEYLNGGNNIDKVKNISVTDFYNIWLANDCKDKKETTRFNYAKIIRNYILPAIGDKYIMSISHNNLCDIIDNLYNNGMAINSLTVVIGVLSKSMEYACRERYFAISPAIGLKIPKGLKPDTMTRKMEKVVISADIMRKIYERFPPQSSSYLPLRIAYETGMRLSEIFALVWEDIDFANKTITVNRQIQWHQDKDKSGNVNGSSNGCKGYWYLTNPKYNSFRIVDIPESLVVYLYNEKVMQGRKRTAYAEYYKYYYAEHKLQYNGRANNPHYPENRICNTPSDNIVNFVCVRDNGEYVSSRTMQHTSAVIKKEIMPEFTFHSLRHTYTTRLHDSGVDLKYISAQLGHKELSVTADIYTHVSEDNREKQKKVINDIFK